jgi:hypothetical protein
LPSVLAFFIGFCLELAQEMALFRPEIHQDRLKNDQKRQKTGSFKPFLRQNRPQFWVPRAELLAEILNRNIDIILLQETVSSRKPAKRSAISPELIDICWL